MKACKVTTESGYSWSTSINPKCSDDEIKKYFIGNRFDVGVYPVEKMEKVVSVEMIRSITNGN